MIKCYFLSETTTFQNIEKYILQYPLTISCGYGTTYTATSAAINADLIFVEMGKITENAQLLAKLHANSILVFLSKDPMQAITAFRLRAFDFITLPITEHSFNQCMHKFIHTSLLFSKPVTKRLNIRNDFFFIRAEVKGKKEMLVKCNDLAYIEAIDDMIILYLCNGEQIVSHYTLREMAIFLPPACFLRIHKSFIINYHQIEAIEGNRLFLSGLTKTFTIGNRYKKTFLDLKSNYVIRKQKQL